MCLEDPHHVRLSCCPHDVYHLRVANTTLHLTRRQLLALHTELNRCVRNADEDAAPNPAMMRRWLGQSPN